MPTYDADVLPATTGLNLGDATHRWDGYFQDLDVSGSTNLTTSVPAHTQSGADFGVKVNAAITAASAVGGGVVDARGLSGNQASTTTIAVAPNVILQLADVHLTSTASPVFTVGIGARIRGQKDTTRITWSADNAAVVMDSVSAAEVGNLLFSPGGTGSSVRGVELRNTTGDNKWNYVHDIRMAAASVQTGQYAVAMRASEANAMYWNTVERIQGIAIDWTVVLEGDTTSGGEVCNGNFIRDILGAANTGAVWLKAAGDNHIFGVFHSLSGGPAVTRGVKFGNGNVDDAASNNHVYGLISDAGSSAIAYDITANSKGNIVYATVQGGTPVRGTAGDGNMAFESTFSTGVIIYWDGVKLYRSATDQLSLDDHLNITASAPVQAAFRRVGANATDFAFVAGVTGDSTNRFQVSAGGKVTFTDGTAATDVGIERSAAGVVKINDGSTGSGNLNVGKIPTYNTIATVSNGVPAEYATVDLTAQTAAITTTTLYAVPASGAGQYRLTWNAKITTAATTGAGTSTLGALTIVYTDPDSVVVTVTAPASIVAGTIATTSTANTTGTALLGLPLTLNCKASTNVTYAMAYASDTAAQMAYNLHIKLEAL